MNAKQLQDISSDKVPGDEIRAFRTQKEWSQQKLADILGVSLRSIRRWELGKMACKGSSAKLLRILMESDK